MVTLPNRRILIGILMLLLLGSIAWYGTSASSAGESDALAAKVRKGGFDVTVTTTGELRARQSVPIQGPSQAQMINVYQTRITSIVSEGTLVKKGDVIADLDRSTAAGRLSDVTLNLQKAQAQYTSTQLDSALTLAQAREDIRAADYALEEKKLAREQSQYEAPTVKRQAEIDFERAQRQAAQARANYQTKLKQAVAKMSEAAAERDRQANQLALIQKVLADFTVRAPSAGMVIYVRQWNGEKKAVGAQWSPWDPTVATLPDLTRMESVTYVNEVDVRKVAVGQKVQIALDADPSKKLTGEISSVANVGEQRPNQDAKVFEVEITVTQSDTTLRPGMTTGNVIQVASIPDALHIPIEAVSADSTGSFVFSRRGRGVVKQQIVTGAMNDNEIVVLRGLEEGDQVLLTPPADAASLREVRLPGGALSSPAGPAKAAEPSRAARPSDVAGPAKAARAAKAPDSANAAKPTSAGRPDSSESRR